MSSVTNGTNGASASPKITLYTSHQCPYAHRTHITLKELGLPYEEVIIDLDKPREQWYLDINPRGLVPSIKYSDGSIHEQIITESQVVDQFLIDIHPSHLEPSFDSPAKTALFRARLNFFMDTWNTKVASHMFDMLKAESHEEKMIKCNEWVRVMQKELSPLLADANPFFGGSGKLTIAEVHTAPFILRVYALCDGEFIPSSFKETLNNIPNVGKWAQLVCQQPSVLDIWDEELVLDSMRKLKAKIKAMQANYGQARSKCPFA